MCNVDQGHSEITAAENYMIMDYIYFSTACCGDDYCRNLIQMKNCLLVMVCDIFNEILRCLILSMGMGNLGHVWCHLLSFILLVLHHQLVI